MIRHAILSATGTTASGAAAKSRIIRKFCSRPARGHFGTKSQGQLEWQLDMATDVARPVGMSTDDDALARHKRRRFLIGATTVVGGIGAVAAATPFVMSFWPSERAKAAGAPVEIDISKLEPGQKVNAEWRGKVTWVINRTPEMLAMLPKLDDRVADPKSEVDHQPSYCKNENRSIKPNLFVAVGICTHLGCSPTFRPEIAPADLGADWPGGFFCPCHQSKFDLAGRVFKGVPAPTNLVVPPHRYASDTKVVIGEDTKA
jgi:ubiquinol-cytochrome c reductase iron-sulfur subunit